MKKLTGYILYAAAAVTLTGCGALNVSRTVALPGLKPVEANRVRVVEEWPAVTQPYEVVGKATLYRNAGGVPKEGALKKIRAMAAAMGGDGVIGLQGTTSFRSALIVRWLAPGEQPRPVKTPFVVGVLAAPEDKSARGNRERIAEEVHLKLILLLDSRGYYVLPAIVGGITGGLEQVQNMNAANRRALGGKDAHLLLEFAFVNRSDVIAGVTSLSFADLRVRLLDKQSGEIIYTGSGSGSGGGPFATSGGLLATLVAPDEKRMEAAVRGIEKALEGLPAVLGNNQ